jgi:cation-transporting ATPase E
VGFLADGASIAAARTALTAQLIVCGLLLIPFVEPTTPAWTGGDELSGDPRPSLLALGMLGVFGLIIAVPSLRNTFELTLLHPADYLLIGGLGAVWALIIRLLWRQRWFERLLSLEME